MDISWIMFGQSILLSVKMNITNKTGMFKNWLNICIHEEVISNIYIFFKCILRNLPKQFCWFNQLPIIHHTVILQCQSNLCRFRYSSWNTNTYKVKYITIPKLSSIVHSALFLCYSVQIQILHTRYTIIKYIIVLKLHTLITSASLFFQSYNTKQFCLRVFWLPNKQPYAGNQLLE